MSQEVKVTAWVRIEDDCPMQYYSTEESFYFTVGSLREDFELTFTKQSVTRFVELANHALHHATPGQHEPVALADLTQTAR